MNIQMHQIPKPVAHLVSWPPPSHVGNETWVQVPVTAKVHYLLSLENFIST